MVWLTSLYDVETNLYDVFTSMLWSMIMIMIRAITVYIIYKWFRSVSPDYFEPGLSLNNGVKF